MSIRKVYKSFNEDFVATIEAPDVFKNSTQKISVNQSIRSPLRYPGGKTRGVEFITRFFPKNLDKLLSPFFGGGSIELCVAA